MQFDKQELLSVLNVFRNIIRKDDSVPIFECLKFSDDFGDGIIFGYNGVYGAAVSFDTGGLIGLIPYRRLLNFVERAPENTIDITIENGIAYFVSGSSRAKVALSDGYDDYPVFDDVLVKAVSESQQMPDEFYSALIDCSVFAAKRSNRTCLLGVNISDDFITAADGYKIARYRCSLKMGNFIIPAEFCNTLKTIDGLDSIYVDSSVCVVCNDSIFLFSSLIEDEYLDLSAYLPDVAGGKFFALPTERLREGLRRVADFSGDSLDGECSIKLGDEISIRYEDSISRIRDVFNFAERIPDVELVVTPRHLDVILSYCKKFYVLNDKHLFCGQSDDGKFLCVVAVKVS